MFKIEHWFSRLHPVHCVWNLSPLSQCPQSDSEGILDTCLHTYGFKSLTLSVSFRGKAASLQLFPTGLFAVPLLDSELVTHEKHKVLVSWRPTLQFCSVFSAPNRGPGCGEQPHVLPSSSKQLSCPCLLAVFPLSHRTSFQRPQRLGFLSSVPF